LPLPAEGSALARCWNRLLWLVLLGGLFVWQGWMTLALFGPDDPWQRLCDAQPVLSGSHPLHLYHGYLGAQALWQDGSSVCYDPSFQAGYPKPPVFDSASRPAELCLYLSGGEFRPAAYKIGLAVCYLLLPLGLLLAARGIGLDRPAAWLATAAGLLVCWGVPCRPLLGTGDLDVLLSSLAFIAPVGLRMHFDRSIALSV